MQLNELVLTTTGRIVHDLGKAHRRPGPPGLERVFNKRAPLTVIHRAGAERGVARKLDRRRVLKHTVGNLGTAAFTNRQLGIDKHVRTSKTSIKAMNGENIVSSFQSVDVLTDVKTDPRHR